MTPSLLSSHFHSIGLVAGFLSVIQCVCIEWPLVFRLIVVPVFLGLCALALRFGFGKGVGGQLVDFHRLLPKGIVGAAAGALCAIITVVYAGKSLESAWLGISPGQVTAVEGVLKRDAWISGQGDVLVNLVDIERTESRAGVTAAAKGIMRIYIPYDSVSRAAGSRIRFILYSCRPVTDRSWHWVASGLESERDPPLGLASIRASIVSAVEQALAPCGPRVAGFSLALLLGRQDEIDSDMADAFYTSGCAHLVALSGMHIALIGALFFRLCMPILGAVAARIIALIVCVCFVWIAGPYPSALRALFMFGFMQIASMFGLRLQGLAALCISVPVAVLVDPLLPLNVGYLLSFGALAGILMMERWLRDRSVRILRPLFAKEIAAGFAAQIGTIPLLWFRGIAWYPQGLVAGIVLGPLVLLFMGAAGIQTLWGILAPGTVVPGIVAILDWLYTIISAIGAFFSWAPQEGL